MGSPGRGVPSLLVLAALAFCSLALPASAGTVDVGCASAMNVTAGLGTEAAWSTVGWTQITNVDINVPGGALPASVGGEFKMLWDANYVYVLWVIKDSTINDTQTGCVTPGNFNDSAVEVYFDMNNVAGCDNFPNAGQSQLHLVIASDATTNPATLVCEDGNAGQNIAGYPAGTLLGDSTGGIAPNGYVVELAVPWSYFGVTPYDGMNFEFDAQFDNDQGTNNRQYQVSWNGGINDYSCASGFGDAVLNFCEPTWTVTETPTKSPTYSFSPTASKTLTYTDTYTITASPTVSPSNTASPTPVATACGGNPAFVSSTILATGCAGNGSNTSFTYTVPAGSNQILLVQVENDTTANAVSGITWDGTPMLTNASLATSVSGWSNGYIDTYYLVNPTAATVTDGINITIVAGCSWNVVATIYKNINTSSPFGTIVSKNNSSASASYDDAITTVNSNSIIHDLFAYANGTFSFSGLSGTQLFPYNSPAGNNAIYGSYLTTTTAGLYNLDYTPNSSQAWTSQTIELNAESACGTPTDTFTATPSNSPLGTLTKTLVVSPTPTITCGGGGAPNYVTSDFLYSGNYMCPGPNAYTFNNTAGSAVGTVMIVRIVNSTGCATAATGITYDGTAMTLLSNNVASDNSGTQTWYLTDAPTGSNSLSVSYLATCTSCSENIGVDVYSNVNTASPFGAHVFANDSANITPWNNSITSTSPNSILDEAVEIENTPASFSPASPQVLLNYTGATDYCLRGSYLQTSSVGSYTFTNYFDTSKTGSVDMLEILGGGRPLPLWNLHPHRHADEHAHLYADAHTDLDPDALAQPFAQRDPDLDPDPHADLDADSDPDQHAQPFSDLDSDLDSDEYAQPFSDLDRDLVTHHDTHQHSDGHPDGDPDRISDQHPEQHADRHADCYSLAHAHRHAHCHTKSFAQPHADLDADAHANLDADRDPDRHA